MFDFVPFFVRLTDAHKELLENNPITALWNVINLSDTLAHFITPFPFHHFTTTTFPSKKLSTNELG